MADRPLPILAPLRWLTSTFRHLTTAFVAYHAHAPFRIRAIAWLGAVSLPLYYFVWVYVFPQPYENMPLRLAGSALCVGLALSPRWPRSLQRFYYPYVYAVLVLVLPTFFTFMLLMNQMSVAWQMSVIVALLFAALLFDTLNTVIAVFLGVGLGILAFVIVHPGAAPTWTQLENVPVLLFTLAAIRILLSFNDRFVAEEKMRAARTLAGHIAHEMRTPLLGIQLDASKARLYMPSLVDALRYARAHGWQGPVLRPAQMDLLGQSMDRIREHATSAGLIVDMLLFNARHDTIDRKGMRPIAIGRVLTTAVERYHFRPGERDKVVVTIAHDFSVLGSEVMLIHVFFNLLKNSLRAVEPYPDGRVDVRVDGAGGQAGRMGSIIIRDTGAGISAELLPDLFTAFRTTSEAGTGSGLGLAFCKLAVESSGGSIFARSPAGQGASFVMTLPMVAPDGPGSADQTNLPPETARPAMASSTGSPAIN